MCLILTAFNIRELIVNSIPLNLKHAVSVGIGLFIAFIGLKGTGLIVDNPATLVSLGNMKNPAVLVGLAGVLVIGVLLTKKIKITNQELKISKIVASELKRKKIYCVNIT